MSQFVAKREGIMLTKMWLGFILAAVAVVAMGCIAAETPDVSATVAAELTRLAPTATQESKYHRNQRLYGHPTIFPTITPIPPTQTPLPTTKPKTPTATPSLQPTNTLQIPTKLPPDTPTLTPTPRQVITEYFPPGYYDNIIDHYPSYKKYCNQGLEQLTLLDGSIRRYCINKRSPTPTPTSTPKPYVAPTPTQLPYTVDYKIYMYSAPNHGVFDIPLCFEERTHRDDGITYTQDVKYRITYKDRQGRKREFGLTFALFDRGQRTEYIQAYESTSPGAFDDPPTTATIQGFKDIKSGKARPHHKGCN